MGNVSMRPKTPSDSFSLLVVCLLAITLAGCMPGQQSYWDAQVKEMCAKDGGVTIYQKLRISESEMRLLGTVGGMIGIPAKDLAKPNAPVYEELKIVDIRDSNPRVSRSEMLIVRRSDGATVARAIIYARSGGDFPSPAHPSSFSCPEFNVVISELQQLFVVERDSR
jgi:hypothetical protein